MHTRLLNLGFRSKGNGLYACEDILVSVENGKLYLMPMMQEVTIDELESILISY